MSVTKVADVFEPQTFNNYVLQESVARSRLVQSGIIERSPQFDALAAGGGRTVEMPFWNDLEGDDEVIDDTNPLGVDNITSGLDIAAIHNRGKAFGENDLAGMLAGEGVDPNADPIKIIGDRFANYWVRREQALLVATLNGIFSAASMAANTLDIYESGGSPADDTNWLTGSTFIDAQLKLGDWSNSLVAIAMHSATRGALLKQDEIEFIPQSEGKKDLERFRGLEVIQDDSLPVETIDGKAVYHTFLFGKGALASGFQTIPTPIPGRTNSDWYSEWGRQELYGNTFLINRRRFILHPRGVKWTNASVSGKSPTNTEVADAQNWLRVYNQKLIRIVRIRHNNYND